MSCRIHMGGLYSSLVFFFLIALLMMGTALTSSSASLKVGFYDSTCPSAEAIVRKTVFDTVDYSGTAAGIIRLHFHDCFVRGCDGSLLLDSTPGNPSEKEGKPILRGFEVIDEAKARIEAECPNTVSCADIIAFAARDSASKFGPGIDYAVPAGRRDGRVSKVSDIHSGNLPPPDFNVKQLRDIFALKGLSLDEMVTLSGAHSIGDTPCRALSFRLYSFNATHPQDPSMDPAFAAYLKTMCPPSTNTTPDGHPSVRLDMVTPYRLDNRFYKNLRNHKGVLKTDQVLWDDPSTASMVRSNANDGAEWASKFAAAMVHMGSIEVLTGTEGEIRKNCRVVN